MIRSGHWAAALFAASLLWTPAAADAKRPSRSALHAAEAEARYQAGVDHYAGGRLPEALLAFEDALKLNPEDRAARAAVNRLRAERTRTLSEAPVVSRAPPPASSPGRHSASLIGLLPLLFRFERAIGDAYEREGRLRAMQGRILQLLAERRVSARRRRRFDKDAELHALSRRLSSGTPLS